MVSHFMMANGKTISNGSDRTDVDPVRLSVVSSSVFRAHRIRELSHC